MVSSNNKISSRQLLVMFIVSILSLTTRLFPTLCARIGGVAGWIAPIVASVALFLLLGVHAAFFKNPGSGIGCIGDAIEVAFGKVVGKTVLTVYFLWAAILYMVYIRYYAERLLSTIFPYSNVKFFLMAMLAVVFFAARGRLEVFARFSEFAILLFTCVIVAFFVFLAPSVKISNLLPVTRYDALPALKAAYPAASIFGYISLFMFLGNFVSDKQQLRTLRVHTTLYTGVSTLGIMIFTVGSLGYQTAARMPVPFFSATKLINIMQSFDRFEALLLSIWVVSDFILITAFTFLLLNMGRKILNAPETRNLASPLIFLGYVGGLYIASSRYEMEAFSSSFLTVSVNVVIGFVVPALALVVLRLRRRL